MTQPPQTPGEYRRWNGYAWVRWDGYGWLPEQPPIASQRIDRSHRTAKTSRTPRWAGAAVVVALALALIAGLWLRSSAPSPAAAAGPSPSGSTVASSTTPGSSAGGTDPTTSPSKPAATSQGTSPKPSTSPRPASSAAPAKTSPGAATSHPAPTTSFPSPSGPQVPPTPHPTAVPGRAVGYVCSHIVPVVDAIGASRWARAKALATDITRHAAKETRPKYAIDLLIVGQAQVLAKELTTGPRVTAKGRAGTILTFCRQAGYPT